MALFQSKTVNIGGAPKTKSPGKGETKRLWDWYHDALKTDLDISIAKAKELWDDGGIARVPVKNLCFKTFARKIDPKDEKLDSAPLVMYTDPKDRSLTGQKVAIELRVGGRLVQDVFEPRMLKRSGKEVEVKGSRNQALVPHQNAVTLLSELLAAVEGAEKNDGGLGSAIHKTAKEACDPANRVADTDPKTGETGRKAKARALKPWNEEADNYVAV